MPLPKFRRVAGQPSWPFESNSVSAFLTELGGQLGPVTFRFGAREFVPYSVAPWAEEKVAAETPAIIRALRGDFFCCPFGANVAAWRGERHPVHGETANARWQLEGLARAGGRTKLHASLATTIRAGRVDKLITLVDDHPALYVRHEISGMRGPMNVGHHAMIRFPDTPAGGVVSTSAFTRGQVFPEAFENPEIGGYQSLKPGATFRSLDRVPLLAGGYADLTRFPARRGFEDLVMLTSAARRPLAWTAVVFPHERLAWFALRDPRVLRHTVLWISNGGRHYAPWNGRHTAVMGLEDVTGYFHFGLAESANANPLNRRGIPTTLTLDPRQPTAINYIMAAAELPAGFSRVSDIAAEGDEVELRADNGKRARVRVTSAFLERGAV